MDSESYKVIYDEARAAVNRQPPEVEEVRAAAGRVLGVGTVAVSVVGGIKSINDGLGWLAWVVAALFIAAVFLVGQIWRPRSGWRFDPGAASAIEHMLEPETEDGTKIPMSLAEVYRERALHLEHDFDTNAALLGKLQRLFRWLLGTEGLLIVVLVVSLM